MSTKSKLKIEIEEGGLTLVDIQGESIPLLAAFCRLFEQSPSLKEFFKDAVEAHNLYQENKADEKRKAAEN